MLEKKFGAIKDNEERDVAHFMDLEDQNLNAYKVTFDDIPILFGWYLYKLDGM